MNKKTNNNPYLSIVVPAYNEEKNLNKGVLDQVSDYLKKQKYTWEVLIVDDGSKDNTTKIVSDFISKHKNFKLSKEPHRGKGGTVIAGMLKAKGEIVVFDDMDQATPIYELEKILPKFKQGYDIAIGSRSGRKGANFIRKVMAFGFMALRTLILRLPFKDTQCGFKGFKKEAVSVIFKKMEIFNNSQVVKGSAVTAGFDLELLYIARKMGFKIAEVPVEWEEKGDRGTSGVNPIKDSWDGLRDLIKVRLNAIQGKYK
ncbi:glycosyltransferase family 2 protein [Candidatus Dojkabacteria bacterium]|nr:glycosyltransferase family 2 protein [Candidatus Dojkabacteria bacterium]